MSPSVLIGILSKVITKANFPVPMKCTSRYRVQFVYNELNNSNIYRINNYLITKMEGKKQRKKKKEENKLKKQHNIGIDIT